MPFKATKYQIVSQEPPVRVLSKSPKYLAELVDITGVWPLPDILHRETDTVFGRMYGLVLIEIYSPIDMLKPGAVRDCLRWYVSHCIRERRTQNVSIGLPEE